VASLIPQHFKLEHGHKLTNLSDEELQHQLLEAEQELVRAGITIDSEAKEVVVLTRQGFQNNPARTCR